LSWGKTLQGGKGDNPVRFRPPPWNLATKAIFLVANSGAGQVVKFYQEGKFVETFNE